MKKLLLLITLGLTINLFAMEWVCYRYVNGEPTGGYVKIDANSKSVAEKKALKKYREDLGYKTDYVKCK